MLQKFAKICISYISNILNKLQEEEILKTLLSILEIYEIHIFANFYDTNIYDLLYRHGQGKGYHNNCPIKYWSSLHIIFYSYIKVHDSALVFNYIVIRMTE